MSEKIYPSFTALVEAEFLPMYLRHPHHDRLDGRQSVGAEVWNLAGSFEFDGQVWDVSVDNHYEPLMLAYWSARFRGVERTFRRSDTKTMEKLELAEDLQAVRPGRYQYFYVYSRSQRAAG
jgi:hypothetical protein